MHLFSLEPNLYPLFSEGTDSAQICDRIYDDVRDFVIGMYPWSFTIKKTQLAQLVDSPVNEFTYKYSLPSDMLGSGVRAVYDSSSTGVTPINNGWEIIGNELNTDLETVYVDYQHRPTEDTMPTYFVQLLKYYMTWHIAESVTDQITKADYYKTICVGLPSENMRGGMFRQATQIDSQLRPNLIIDDFDLTNVR